MHPIDPTLNTLAADPNALAALKRRALSDEEGAARAAARQFETLLLDMLVKSMRETVSDDGLLDNEGTRMFTGLLDQQFARGIAQQGGLGLADLLVKQLTQLRQPSQGTAPSADNSIRQGDES
jgi:peptidoglycan hydrolase FlgJ